VADSQKRGESQHLLLDDIKPEFCKMLLHNLDLRILWNDFGNRKWNIKLGKTGKRTDKALVRICWSAVGQMGQSCNS
jgi:hypothetical protein